VESIILWNILENLLMRINRENMFLYSGIHDTVNFQITTLKTYDCSNVILLYQICMGLNVQK